MKTANNKDYQTEIIIVPCTKKFKSACVANAGKLGLSRNNRKSVAYFVKMAVCEALLKLGVPKEYVDSIV
jgi:hypothetical protein